MQPSCLRSGVNLGELPAANHDGQEKRKNRWTEELEEEDFEWRKGVKGCSEGKKNTPHKEFQNMSTIKEIVNEIVNI